LTLNRRAIRHPRHQLAGLDRQVRLTRLHPDVQRRVMDLYAKVVVGTQVVVLQ
jgi:hypothetical protein